MCVYLVIKCFTFRLTLTVTKIIFVFINVDPCTLDADLTRGSDTVEATKIESKDTQPVKKVVCTCSVDSHSNNSIVS